MYNMIVL